MSNKLIADFDVEDTLDKIYLLPHNVASETYIWSFQYPLLNYILFTNVKLLKLGLVLTDRCTLPAFWGRFFNWWTDVVDGNLTLTRKSGVRRAECGGKNKNKKQKLKLKTKPI